MNHQRLLVLTSIEDDARPIFEALRRLVPAPVQVIVMADRTVPPLGWLAPAPPAELDEASSHAVERLREAVKGIALFADVALPTEVTPDALASAVRASSSDLVVVGSARHRALALAAGLQKRTPLPVLCLGSLPVATSPRPGIRLACLSFSGREQASVLGFLREHAGTADRAVLLASRPMSVPELAVVREVAGLASRLELLDRSERRWRTLFDARTTGEFDLVVVSRFPPLVLLDVSARPPVLVLPPARPAVTDPERGIDVPDALDDGTCIRLRLEYAGGIGRRRPIEDQEVGFVRAGQLLARAPSVEGTVELPSGLGGLFGLVRMRGRTAADLSRGVETSVSILSAGDVPVLLIDAELEPDALARVRAVARVEPVAVRLRPTRACRSLRARLRAAGLAPLVLDAGAVLDEGDALDVPAQADGVRLARVATRMRAAGFPVLAIVFRGPHRPVVDGFDAVLAEELPSLRHTPAPTARVSSLDARLDVTTGSRASEGNQVQVELDNRLARGWLLDAIASSRERVHFQSYMAVGDDVGRAVEEALAAAGARGIAVRVLVDSLHGLHGSFGAHNPLLERLSSRPGVQLRVGHPITGAPTLEDLKQRDHRKLVAVDGRVALLGGRNLSHEYYTGFAEVPLSPEMAWRMVPWLDAGARVEGPAVATLERSFLQAWTEAGGEPFQVGSPGPAGSTRVRVVVHRGLRDAHSIEAYLALIDGASSHVYAVNGFPLVLEIQHALLRALRRGVRVRTLVGNLTPRHGEEPFRGPLASGRIAATSFVHSRMDPLVAAGAECYELVVARQPSWAPSIPEIRPHVHAKTMSVDGKVCAVGSANLDVTATYWENELMLLVEEPGVATALEARFDQLMAGSARFDRTDPAWKRRAEQRRWMRHWPGVLG